MGSNIFSGLFSGNNSDAAASQAGLSSGAALAAHLQAQAQAAGLIPYQGQQGYNVQNSVFVPKGQGYIVTATPEQLDEEKREFINQKKERFLKHPVVHREAFLNNLRAKAVAADMNSEGEFFGNNRQWYSQSNTGGLTEWINVPIQITLEQYESWHQDALIDNMLGDNNE